MLKLLESEKTWAPRQNNSKKKEQKDVHQLPVIHRKTRWNDSLINRINQIWSYATYVEGPGRSRFKKERMRDSANSAFLTVSCFISIS